MGQHTEANSSGIIGFNAIRLYHTFQNRIPDDGAVWIWLPLTPDISVNIQYITEHIRSISSIFVEDTFVPLVDASLLSLVEVFSLEKKEIRTNRKFIFYAQSDTLAHSLAKVFHALSKDCEVMLMVPAVNDEGAADYFVRNNLPFSFFSASTLRSYNPDLFVVLNDWTKEVHRIFSFCRWMKIPTVCIQESIIDFGDKTRRMQFSDAVIIQGIHTVKELCRKHFFVAGNPRYIFERENDRGAYALINSNFTYGIFENIREKWISDVTQALQSCSIPYKISQHPRDSGNLVAFGEVIPSNAVALPEMLRQSNLVVTRFSSLIHEALAFNVPVVYYNPHGEMMQYDFECNNRFLWYAETPEDLKTALMYLHANTFDPSEIANYLAVHCIPRHGNAEKNIAESIIGMRPEPAKFGIKNLFYLLIYYPQILRLLKTVKGLFTR